MKKNKNREIKNTEASTRRSESGSEQELETQIKSWIEREDTTGEAETSKEKPASQEAAADEDKEKGTRKEKISKFLRWGFFPILFAVMEFFFHWYYFGSLSVTVIHGMLLSAAFGALLNLITMLFGELANKIIAYVVLVIVCIFFNLQLVYGHIFKTFISLYSVQQNAGDATEFWKEALHGIWECMPGVLFLLVMPIVLLSVLLKKKYLVMKREKAVTSIIAVASAVAGFSVAILTLGISGTESHTPYDLFHNNFILDLGIEKLGIVTSTGFDVKQVMFGASASTVEGYTSMDALVVDVPTDTPTPEPTKAPVEEANVPTQAVEATPTPTPTPTPI
ncbi:MAG: hypothetical protein ILP10_04180, partial [Lachnospiraceae bacterium]|nr:hypothetical protein [Lachnospiraceae bacterium]